MQSLTWYKQRLGTMSPAEIAWRAGNKLRDSIDRCAYPLRRRPVPLSRILNGNVLSAPGCSLVVGSRFLHPGAADPLFAEAWRAEVVTKADDLLEHRIRLFRSEESYLGDEIDWNRDYRSGKSAPKVFAPKIDYRDHAVTGDAKWVWELSRHHHLVVFGRAYRLTGDERYACEAIDQLERWIRQCPFGTGMNWRSPLELAVRLINWVWALELLGPPSVLTQELTEQVVQAAYRHLWEISRKYSRYSSANNHLVGEAAGVFIGSSYFSRLEQAPRWQARSREILAREIIEQTYEDGGTREQAMGYHLFVLQFFLLAGLCARNMGEDFPTEYWARLERMFEFAGACTEGGDAVPMFGDSDDGRVLDLGGACGDVRPWMAVAAALFGRADFKAWSGGFSEPAYWLLGGEGHRQYQQIGSGETPRTVSSRAFRESGFYLLQCGNEGAPDRISVAFDCGELGFKSIAAHGHADALSFTLRAFGRDIIVDSGTYDYFTYPAWRDYFRSTRAHNTIVIDGKDQSEMLGPFLWGRRAQARCLRWESSADGAIVVGEHDGYGCLADPVVHRRTISLDGCERAVVITDQIVARERHEVSMYLHFSEDCQVRPSGVHSFQIECGPEIGNLELDPRLSVSVATGSEDPKLGWVSRGYHDREPSVTVCGRCVADGAISFSTRITLGKPASEGQRDRGPAVRGAQLG